MTASLPAWLEPVAAGLETITVHDLTRFMPPEGSDPRRSAVLMLFGEGPDGPDLLLTERAHHMRAHPGQVSFPGGSLDEGETPLECALREAHEEIGLEPSTVQPFGVLPDLWIPPTNFAVSPQVAWWRDEVTAPPVHVASPEEVHAIHRVSIDHLRDVDHRIAVRHPSGWVGPGFLIDDDGREVILWGFTAGIIARMFDHLGWTGDIGEPPMRELPEYMTQRDPTGIEIEPNTRFAEKGMGR